MVLSGGKPPFRDFRNHFSSIYREFRICIFTYYAIAGSSPIVHLMAIDALKPLLKALTVIVKFFDQIESYHKKCQYFSGINSFFIIKSNNPIIDNLERLSSRKKAKSLSTFHFSALYTKIPHDKRLAVLNELVDFCFSGGIKRFVKVYSINAFWTNVLNERQITLSKDSIKQTLHYLMNNIYV